MVAKYEVAAVSSANPSEELAATPRDMDDFQEAPPQSILVSPTRPLWLTILLIFLVCSLSLSYNFAYDFPSYGGDEFLSLFGISTETRALTFTLVQIPALVMMLVTAPLMVALGVRGTSLIMAPLELAAAWVQVLACYVARSNSKSGWYLMMATRVLHGLTQDPTCVIQSRLLAHFFSGPVLPRATAFYALAFRAASFISALVLAPVCSGKGANGVLNGAFICAGVYTFCALMEILLVFMYGRSKTPDQRSLLRLMSRRVKLNAEKRRERRKQRKLAAANRSNTNELLNVAEAPAESASGVAVTDQLESGTESTPLAASGTSTLEKSPLPESEHLTFWQALKQLQPAFICIAAIKFISIGSNISFSSALPQFLTMAFGYATPDASARQSAISLVAMITPLIIGMYLSYTGEYAGTIRFGLMMGCAGVVSLLFLGATYNADNPPNVILSYIPFIFIGCLHGGVFTSFSSAAPLLSKHSVLSTGLAITGAAQAAVTAGLSQLFGFLQKLDAGKETSSSLPIISFGCFWLWALMIMLLGLAVSLDQRRDCVLSAGVAAKVINRAVEEQEGKQSLSKKIFAFFHHSHQQQEVEYEETGVNGSDDRSDTVLSGHTGSIRSTRSVRSVSSVATLHQATPSMLGTGDTMTVTSRLRAASTISANTRARGTSRLRFPVNMGPEHMGTHAVRTTNLRNFHTMATGTIFDTTTAPSSQSEEVPKSEQDETQLALQLAKASSGILSTSSRRGPRVKFADEQTDSNPKLPISGWQLKPARRQVREGRILEHGEQPSTEHSLIGLITSDNCVLPLPQAIPLTDIRLQAGGQALDTVSALQTADKETPAIETKPSTRSRTVSSGVLWQRRTESVYMWPAADSSRAPDAASAIQGKAPVIPARLLSGASAVQEMQLHRRLVRDVEHGDRTAVSGKQESSSTSETDIDLSDSDGPIVSTETPDEDKSGSLNSDESVSESMIPQVWRDSESIASDDSENGHLTINQLILGGGPMPKNRQRQGEQKETEAARAAREGARSMPAEAPGVLGRDEIMDRGDTSDSDSSVAAHLLARQHAFDENTQDETDADDHAVRQEIVEYFLQIDKSAAELKEEQGGHNTDDQWSSFINWLFRSRSEANAPR